jgi:hypothetical protein
MRHYLYISDLKVADILSDTPSKAIRKTAVKLGVSAGVDIGIDHAWEHRPRESRQALALVAEEVLRSATEVVGPLDVTSNGQWFGSQMAMYRGWQPQEKTPGMWFGGLCEQLAVVLAGSELHSMGPRAKKETDYWMSDLPDQLHILAHSGVVSESKSDVLNAVGAAVGFSRGNWGGLEQELEFLAVANAVLQVPQSEFNKDVAGVERLIIGSPLYVAQIG